MPSLRSQARMADGIQSTDRVAGQTGGGWKMEEFCLTECGEGSSIVLAG